VFFTASGNIIWTYALPGLPALAMLTAGWLDRDPRRRRVDTFVAAGILILSLSFIGMLITEQLTGAFKSAKAVVAAYETRNSGNAALLFVGSHRYSPAFYSRGKAEQLSDVPALTERLRRQGAIGGNSSEVFIALRDRQHRELPSDLRERLKLQGRFGNYELFSMQR